MNEKWVAALNKENENQYNNNNISYINVNLIRQQDLFNLNKYINNKIKLFLLIHLCFVHVNNYYLNETPKKK